MTLYKNNLKTGKYNINSKELADKFLNSKSDALFNVKRGWPIIRGLSLFICDDLNSSFDIK